METVTLENIINNIKEKENDNSYENSKSYDGTTSDE